MTEIEVVPGKRLGKGPKTVNAQTFMMVRYIDLAEIPKVPTSFKWSPFVPRWPMYANDRFGDCVFAEQGHHEQLWSAAGGRPLTPTDQDVLGAYSALTGFRANDPNTDNGTVILDAMNYWRKVGIAGRKIGAFCNVEEHNHSLLRAAMYLFGGLSLGFDLPVAAQSMSSKWTKPRSMRGAGEPGSWGGHCVYAVDYTSKGIVIVTWGQLVTVSFGFFEAYCTEAWAAISPDFLVSETGKTYAGFDTATLQSDLSKVGRPM